MPAYIAIPAAIVLGLIFLTVAFCPMIWLTRSPRALSFRGVRRSTLLLWWIAAAIPWAAMLVLLQLKHHVGISVNGIPELLLALGELIAICAGLISLPLAVIVLTVLWILDHEAVGR